MWARLLRIPAVCPRGVHSPGMYHNGRTPQEEGGCPPPPPQGFFRIIKNQGGGTPPPKPPPPSPDQSDHSGKKRNSIAFGKSTSQRIYREQHTPQIGWKLHKYRLKHALHTLDDHFR